MGGEPGGHRMVPRGLGDSGKGDKEAWGAHREGKGPWGGSLLFLHLCTGGAHRDPSRAFLGLPGCVLPPQTGFFCSKDAKSGEGVWGLNWGF